MHPPTAVPTPQESGERGPLDEVIRLRNRAVYDQAAAAYLDAYAADRSDDHWVVAFCSRVRAAETGARPTRVLDVGCGPALCTALFDAQGVASIGLDLSLEMLREGRAHHGPWWAVQGDMARLPFAARSFGGAHVGYSFLHLTEAGAGSCLEELRRILVPGAPVLILLKEGEGARWMEVGLVPGQFYVKLWSAPELAAALEAGGFTVEVVETSPPNTPEEVQRPRLAVFARRRG